MKSLLNIFSGLSWTYYVIAGLLVAVLLSGYLLKKEIEKTGELSAQNAQLSADLSQAEKDKSNLLSTMQVNSQKSLEDQNERDKLRDKVVQLNKKVSSLTRLTKDKGNASDVKSNSQSSDDIYLSDSLISLFREAYCNNPSSVCANPSESSSGTLQSK